MATSGTTTFESGLGIDDIIQESFDRIGIKMIDGYDLKSARRSLNIMFQEWANRGLHYWEVGKTNLDLVEGQAEYIFYRSTADGTSTTTAPSRTAKERSTSIVKSTCPGVSIMLNLNLASSSDDP